MVANTIRFFTAVFWNVFTVIVETFRRVIFAWARVDRLACCLSVAMLILALIVESSFCLWTTTAAITCLSIAAWRGERWNLKNDIVIGSRRFQHSLGQDAPSGPFRPFQGAKPRTTFAGSVRRPEIVVDVLKQRFA